MTDQLGMFFSNENDVKHTWVQVHHYTIDRGSKYGVSGGRVESDEGLKDFLALVKTNKKYAKATHNMFAARYVQDGSVIERKGDDGEAGASMIILRALRNANLVNVCVVVTRWYGGVHLGADRFRHIQQGINLILQQLGK